VGEEHREEGCEPGPEEACGPDHVTESDASAFTDDSAITIANAQSPRL
jgi:hypothetical protein